MTEPEHPRHLTPIDPVWPRMPRIDQTPWRCNHDDTVRMTRSVGNAHYLVEPEPDPDWWRQFPPDPHPIWGLWAVLILASWLHLGALLEVVIGWLA